MTFVFFAPKGKIPRLNEQVEKVWIAKEQTTKEGRKCERTSHKMMWKTCIRKTKNK